jgi:uncharacterized protein (TIGR04141 family)
MARGPAQRTLTIYLLHDAIADARAAVRPGATHHVISVTGQVVGDLYVRAGEPHTLPWVSFFEGTVDLSEVIGVSTAAVLIITSSKRLFAIAFGFGRMLLQPGVADERFGLKVTLNAVDHTQIRSVDCETLDSPAPHSQIQARVAASIAEFGLDVDQDLLRAVTGIPRDESLGKRLTGKDALRTTGPFTLAALPALLHRYLDESKKTDYREHFPWLDHILEVKNPTVREALDGAIEEKLRREEFEGMWLAVPERVEWQNIDAFTYRNTDKAERHADIHLRTFFDELRNPTAITMEALKRQYRVYAVSDSGDHPYEWPVYQCLYAELAKDGVQYLLNDGTWYQIDAAFRDRIEAAFKRVPKAKCALPNAERDEIERAYNNRVATTDRTYALMDRVLIREPDPKSPIEFCDLYSTSKEIIHVKPYSGSSTLSHLFAQGVTSGLLFAHEPRFRESVNEALPKAHRLPRPKGLITTSSFSIVYAIISKSQRALTIPFFSKVTLQGAVKTLRGVGYNVQLAKIGTNL